jgi:peptidoglycan/xylan/chitin deacetylase (PgdA/CDA1 family)
MSVPVLYYHSIGNHNKVVPWSFLSYPFELFEKQLNYLSKKGFKAISLYELFKYMKDGDPIPSKSVVITFDDGFLDNWVFAFPILKKYNMKATIYINPDFVDKRPIIRNTIQDVWQGKIKIEQLDWWGYLSWDEMKIMEESGIIDIQSHSLSHTWYFCSDEIIDFHHPGATYYWLFWNEHPDEKPFWLKNYNDSRIEFGRPIYKHGKSLVVKKYFEDLNLRKTLVNYVKNNGNKDFFKQPNWKKLLFKEAQKFKRNNKLSDRFETDDEYINRIKIELGKSKQIIEANLNKKVRFLCWPGGGQNQKTFEVAYQVGYISTTKGEKPNKFGNDPSKISRLSGVPPIRFPLFQEKFDILFLFLQLKRGQDKLIGKIFGGFIRFLYYLLKAKS